MAMKEYSIFSKACYQNFSVISRTHIGQGSYTFAGMQSVYSVAPVAIDRLTSIRRSDLSHKIK